MSISLGRASVIGGGTDSQRAWEPSTAADLRRKDGREPTQRLLHLAEGLPAPDRELLRSVFQDGRRVVEVAALVGTDSRTLQRRVRRLAARLGTPLYAFALEHRGRWPALRRRIATSCILEGRSLRQASAEMAVSIYTVRRHYEAVLALFEAAEAARSRQ
jgi:hypothetical protein